MKQIFPFCKTPFDLVSTGLSACLLIYRHHSHPRLFASIACPHKRWLCYSSRFDPWIHVEPPAQRPSARASCTSKAEPCSTSSFGFGVVFVLILERARAILQPCFSRFCCSFGLQVDAFHLQILLEKSAEELRPGKKLYLKCLSLTSSDLMTPHHA